MAKYRIHVYHPMSDKSFPGDLVEYSRTEAYSHFLEIKAIVDQGLPLHFTQKRWHSGSYHSSSSTNSMRNKFSKSTIMKKILIIILALQSISAFSQKDAKFWFNRYKLIVPIAAVGGVTDGVTEIISHKYHLFQKRHPGANPQYWNPNISWRNKYKNGDPAQGEKYFLSSSILVPITDGYHLLRFVDHSSSAALVAIPLCRKDREDWWVYVIDFAVSFGTRSSAFHTTYHNFYGG